MNILAVETSCDDTGIAVLKVSGRTKPDFRVLSNVISSQTEIHRKWGGIYPALAKREHQRNLTLILKKSLSEAKLLKTKIKNKKLKTQIKNQRLKRILIREKKLYEQLKNFLKKYQKPKIDVIAVTTGPGLEPCLWVGVNFAKALSYYWDIPLVPVNHIEAHILANFVGKNSKLKSQNAKPQLKTQNLKLPAVCLVVSGGHTQLILMRDFGKYKIIGETRDDAAGECFDKTARILGLGYPGGPAVAEKARQEKSETLNSKFETNSKFQILNSKFNIKLPRPMMYSKNYDFSFSGLKTAVLYQSQKAKISDASGSRRPSRNQRYKQKMAKEIQQAIIDVLIKKTFKAAKNYKAKSIILGGGVTANKELKKQFKSKIKKEIPDSKFYIPDSKFCTDNAAMVGITGLFHLKEKTKNLKKIKAEANLRIS